MKKHLYEILLTDFEYGYLLGILSERKFKEPKEVLILDDLIQMLIKADRLLYEDLKKQGNDV